MGGGCATWGGPSSGAIWEACGALHSEGPLGDEVSDVFVISPPQPEDYPTLKNAFIAWGQRDYPRMIGQCLVALGVTAPTVTSLPSGPGWTFHQDSALVFLSVDREHGEILVESPMVRVPVRQRVPLLRTLLELNACALGASRFCLRGGIVVLRYADRIDNVSPAKLVGAIKEVALRADRYDDVLRLAFGAKMIGPEAKRHPNPWGFLGTPVKLRMVRGERVGPAPPPPISRPSDVPAPDPVGRMLDAADALLDVARIGQSLAKPLFFAHKPATLAMLHRAIAFRAAHVGGVGCPDAINLLFSQLQVTCPGFFEGPPYTGVTETGAMLVDATLGRIVNTRAQVGAQPTIEIPQLRTALDAKTLLRKLLDEIVGAPPDATLRHVLLLCAICELAQRARMTGPMQERVQGEIAGALAAGPTTESIAALDELLRSVAGT